MYWKEVEHYKIGACHYRHSAHRRQGLTICWYCKPNLVFQSWACSFIICTTLKTHLTHKTNISKSPNCLSNLQSILVLIIMDHFSKRFDHSLLCSKYKLRYKFCLPFRLKSAFQFKPWFQTKKKKFGKQVALQINPKF